MKQESKLVTYVAGSIKSTVDYIIVWQWRAPDQEVDRRGLGERLCKKCQARKLNREDAMDHSRCKTLIKEG